MPEVGALSTGMLGESANVGWGVAGVVQAEVVAIAATSRMTPRPRRTCLFIGRAGVLAFGRVIRRVKESHF
ncbi:hypothetical protein GCM10022381_41820 [Leifsonia kafniensis]|uniref:Uncharacterized protein n=1 Tax=Leifsonia kafniensis TaxID=475957 RepID=A0ABP7LAN6_9MICO